MHQSAFAATQRRIIPWPGLTILAATNDRVFAAAGNEIRHQISHADAFATAAAAELDGILVTGGPELIQLRAEIQILTRSRPLLQ